jgi:hypothetical protein
MARRGDLTLTSHHFPPSIRRPASVIFTRATSIVRGPMTMRSVCAPGADRINQQLDRKAVRDQQRPGHAVGGRGQQIEGAAVLGFGAAAAT